MTDTRQTNKDFFKSVEDALAPLGVVITGAELGSEYPFDGKFYTFTLQGVLQRKQEYRPYTNEELSDIVGKVIDIDNGATASINHTILVNNTKNGTTERAVVVSGCRKWFTSDDLLQHAVFHDTKEKCGVSVSSI